MNHSLFFFPHFRDIPPLRFIETSLSVGCHNLCPQLFAQCRNHVWLQRKLYSRPAGCTFPVVPVVRLRVAGRTDVYIYIYIYYIYIYIKHIYIYI